MLKYPYLESLLSLFSQTNIQMFGYAGSKVHISYSLPSPLLQILLLNKIQFVFIYTFNISLLQYYDYMLVIAAFKYPDIIEQQNLQQLGIANINKMINKVESARKQQNKLQPWENFQEMAMLSASHNPEQDHHVYHLSKRDYDYPQFIRNAKTLSPSKKDHNIKIKTKHKTKNTVNFIQKNQANIKSFNYYRNIADYSTFFNAEFEESMPFNGNATTLTNFYRKPLINTTYISYIQDKQNQQTDFKLRRPRTTSAQKRNNKNTLSVKKYRHEQREIDKYINKQYNNIHKEHSELDETQVKNDKGFQNYHLQKILKLKEKLRQRLKKTSLTKSIEREAHLHSSIDNRMKIIDEPKMSRQRLEMNKKIYTDKWKLKMKKKNQIPKQLSKSKNKIKSNFSVVGGSIYK